MMIHKSEECLPAIQLGKNRRAGLSFAVEETFCLLMLYLASLAQEGLFLGLFNRSDLVNFKVVILHSLWIGVTE